MDIDYGRHYRHLYENHWWWRAREDVIVETLTRFKPVGGWRSILDVGCGDGLFLGRLAHFGAEVEGVEPEAELVTPSGDHADRIYVGPFDESFQPKKRYSLILMLDVLEHISDPVGALRRVVHLLDEGGLFIATVPAFPILWTKHDELNHHYLRYTKQTFGDVARRAGLDVLHQEYFFYWTFPAKLLIRLKETLLPASATMAQVPPSWINATLKLLSRAERMLLPSLPFGSSLLVVAGTSEGAIGRGRITTGRDMQ